MEMCNEVDLIVRHGHLVTMDGQRRIFRDGAVAIRDGKIIAVGRDAEVAACFVAASERDVGGALVHPGFVDAHAHTGMDLIRGLTPDVTRDWTAVENPFFAALTPEQERLGTLLATMEMVTNGITTYADTGSSVDLGATVDAIATVGLRGIPGAFIADQPLEVSGLQSSIDECLRRLTTQIDAYPAGPGARVHCAVTIAGMGTASDALLCEAKRIADATGLPLIMHQSWELEEVHACQERCGRRPVEHLAEIGLLDRNVTLVHMIQVNACEVDLVAQGGASVIHCPGASIRRSMGAIRHGKFPDMLAAGITVALGSDGHSGKHDIARQAFLAATLHREQRDTMPVIGAATALEMATLHGAHALGLEASIGSLEPGKRADLVIHRRDRPETRPRFSNPVPNLVYNALSQTVDAVLVDGEAIFDHGRFTRFDQEELYALLDRAALDLEARLAASGREDAWPVI